MLMTQTKYANKVQEYAAKVGIDNQWKLRLALRDKGISEPTARRAWLHGVNDSRNYRLITALEEVLQVPASRFLQD